MRPPGNDLDFQLTSAVNKIVRGQGDHIVVSN